MDTEAGIAQGAVTEVFGKSSRLLNFHSLPL